MVLTAKGNPPSDSIEKAKEIIRQRIDGLGVAEPEVTRQGDNVVVELPGVKDRKKAQQIVGQTAKLEFRPVLMVPAPGYTYRPPDPEQGRTASCVKDDETTTTTTTTGSSTTTRRRAGRPPGRRRPRPPLLPRPRRRPRTARPPPRRPGRRPPRRRTAPTCSPPSPPTALLRCASRSGRWASRGAASAGPRPSSTRRPARGRWRSPSRAARRPRPTSCSTPVIRARPSAPPSRQASSSMAGCSPIRPSRVRTWPTSDLPDHR